MVLLFDCCRVCESFGGVVAKVAIVSEVMMLGLCESYRPQEWTASR